MTARNESTSREPQKGEEDLCGQHTTDTQQHEQHKPPDTPKPLILNDTDRARAVAAVEKLSSGGILNEEEVPLVLALLHEVDQPDAQEFMKNPEKYSVKGGITWEEFRRL